MRVGILSDSHDNLKALKKAVTFFNRAKVDLVLHAGDFVAPFSVLVLKDLHCPWKGVFGNNDGEHKGLRGISEGRIRSHRLALYLAGQKILLIHDRAALEGKDASGFSVLIHGHTHTAGIRLEDGILSVNPGECGAWLTHRSTVAILDPGKRKARIVRLAG